MTTVNPDRSSGPRIELDKSRPQSARMYDYYLGGKDNYEVDRMAAEEALTAWPGGRIFAPQTRRYLLRVVRHLAAEHGIRQFLDIGTGIPTSPNTHEAAQRAAPDARVVYTDYDPIVLTHARVLMNSTAQGRIDYIHADLRDPDSILGHPCLTGDDPALNLDRPVALMLIAVLHFLPDDDAPHPIVQRLVDALPSGSFLALSHVTGDHNPEQIEKGTAAYLARGVRIQHRSRADVLRFADGLELVEPGLANIHQWRPDPAADGATAESVTPAEVSCYGLVARKP
jgi:hypothetical protein